MAKRAAAHRRHPRPQAANSYWANSQQPLASLCLLLPMMVLYELGVAIYGTRHVGGMIVSQDIYARSLLRNFFEWFGVTGYFLPGLIVVVMLLCWHVVRHDRWTFEPELYAVMLVESIVLAIPLFVLIGVLGRRMMVALAPDAAPLLAAIDATSWQADLVFSIGAGIYEELLFRVVAIALIHWLFVDILALPDAWGALLAILGSAVLFSLYHFVGPHPFEMTPFLLRFIGGVYLAAVYVLRGFGIAACTHAWYDIFIVLAR